LYCIKFTLNVLLICISSLFVACWSTTLYSQCNLISPAALPSMALP
jgi:hypothetical protein